MLDKSKGYAFTSNGIDFYHGWHGGYAGAHQGRLFYISNVYKVCYDMNDKEIRDEIVYYQLIKHEEEINQLIKYEEEINRKW